MLDSSVLVFDIETVPDIETGRRLYHLSGLSDEDTAKAMAHCRREESGSEFLKHCLHRVVAISVVLRTAKEFRVWSLGEPDSDEKTLITRFFEGLERFRPTLVSWNGSGFDLPVLQYRALHHGVSAPLYWETGDQEQGFRFNNYLSRYHQRHTDLMDVLAGYQARAAAKLHEVSVLLGFPGKLDMDGSAVWDRYQAGDIVDIRQYCETDVVNTYLIYTRFELIRGRLLPEAYAREQALVRDTLRARPESHWQAFLAAWPERTEDHGPATEIR